MRILNTLFLIAGFVTTAGAVAQNASTPPATEASAPAAAPTTPAPAPAEGKRALAARMVALQKPEIERMAAQLTGSAVEPTLMRWQPTFQTIPDAKRAQLGPKVDAEVKAYADGIRKLLEGQFGKSADTALLNAYQDRFSESELRELVAMMESPVFKKYQIATADLGNLWVKDVVESSRSSVLARERNFDSKLAGLMGVEAPKRPSAPAPAPKATPKK